jgi:adenylylsulfate kinase
MTFKILVMGISGSGKTTLSNILNAEIKKLNKTTLRLNADEVRAKYHDWDFTIDGRLRQAQRFYNFSEDATEDVVVCDFIAPIPESRGIFAPDYTIWMNTITRCKYENTNVLFLDPPIWDYRITEFSDFGMHVSNIISSIKPQI